MSHHPNQSKGLAQHSRPPAQDLQRHTARAAASHLSRAELTKRDAGAVESDAAALDRIRASKPLFPPNRCQLCGSARNAIGMCSRPGCKRAP